jgi:hypothetical protein
MTTTPQETNKVWGLMAEFTTPADIMHAAEKVRDAGYRWWDCHTPFPVHGLDKAMGIKPTWLPWFVLGGGLSGAMLGFILQWFSNASSFDFWLIVWVRGYEFLISGKPVLSGPVYPVVMFELTILLASFGAVGGMLLFNGLPLLYHPTLKHPKFARATDDRFFVVIEARDPLFFTKQTTEFLETLRPVSVEVLEP